MIFSAINAHLSSPAHGQFTCQVIVHRFPVNHDCVYGYGECSRGDTAVATPFGACRFPATQHAGSIRNGAMFADWKMGECDVTVEHWSRRDWGVRVRNKVPRVSYAASPTLHAGKPTRSVEQHGTSTLRGEIQFCHCLEDFRCLSGTRPGPEF